MPQPTRPLLFSPASRALIVARECGGKGANLHTLSQLAQTMQGVRFSVPTWRVLGRGAYHAFVSAHQLETQLQQRLATLTSQPSIEEGDGLHGEIERLFLSKELPDDVAAAIEAAWRDLDASLIAVRSSAAGEDSATHSFAGQLSSYLYVDSVAASKDAVKRCWASAFSGRSLAYRRTHGIALDGIEVAVVLQEMIDPDRSGVLFTSDGISGNLDQLLVSAVYGVGEGLVSGALDADSYTIEKATSAITAEIVEKTSAFRRDSQRPGHCQELPVEQALRNAPVLGETQLHQLAAAGLAIEAHYRFPQDIEWALRDDALVILQTRPITTITHFTGAGFTVWDNSNIVESYGGVTSPLTFSFASEAYRVVYIQLCEVMQVPRDVIDGNQSLFQNMLGLLDGRVYYNLGNWYRLLNFFPGFKNNQTFMETMMGVGETLPDAVRDALLPPASEVSWRDRWGKLKVGLTLLRFHLTIDRLVEGFFRQFWEIYRRYAGLAYEQMPLREIVGHYKTLRQEMLENWKVPLINDFLVMVHFGTLKKRCREWCAQLGENLQNDLISGEGGLESAEPIDKIVELAAYLEARPELKAHFLENDPALLYEVIHTDPRYGEFDELIGQYLERFGFRCMSELKLEETDLRSEPRFLFVMIANYLATGQTDLAALHEQKTVLRRAAEQRVQGHLSGGQHKKFKKTLRHARNVVKHRENLRFARTRVFGLARRLFNAAGGELHRLGALAHPRDVFYLHVDEIVTFAEGRAVAANLAEIAAVRKAEFAGYRDKPDPPERFYTEGPPYAGNDWLSESAAVDPGDLAANQLKGLSCCAGRVEARVRVIREPGDRLELNGEILATSRTDPGWVPLFPSVSGLLIERGSLLSHSAIVAREMGIPTIIHLKGLLTRVSDGQRVEMDAHSGVVTLLDENAESLDLASN